MAFEEGKIYRIRLPILVTGQTANNRRLRFLLSRTELYEQNKSKKLTSKTESHSASVLYV